MPDVLIRNDVGSMEFTLDFLLTHALRRGNDTQRLFWEQNTYTFRLICLLGGQAEVLSHIMRILFICSRGGSVGFFLPPSRDLRVKLIDDS